MNCSQVQDILSAYIDDVLDDQEKPKVEEHIGTCAICRQELTDLQHTVRILRSLGEVSPPHDFSRQLICRLKQQVSADTEAKQPAGKSRYAISGVWRQIAAAVLILGFGVGAGLYSLYTGGFMAGGLKSSSTTPVEAPGQVALTQKSSPETTENADDYKIPNGDTSAETGLTSDGKDRQSKTSVQDTRSDTVVEAEVYVESTGQPSVEGSPPVGSPPLEMIQGPGTALDPPETRVRAAQITEPAGEQDDREQSASTADSGQIGDLNGSQDKSSALLKSDNVVDSGARKSETNDLKIAAAEKQDVPVLKGQNASGDGQESIQSGDAGWLIPSALAAALTILSGAACWFFRKRR